MESFYFCKENEKPENEPQNLFGFKSLATPPQNEHLNPFENALYDMIQSIESKIVRNEFLDKLQKDVENIRLSKIRLVFADKSTFITKFQRALRKMIILRKLTKDQVLMQKEKLIKNQSNFQNISELMIQYDVTLTNMHL